MVIDIDIIYKEHYQLFVNFANKIIGDSEDAKDIAHNAILKFYSKYRDNSFKDIAEVRALLIKIIRSYCYNHQEHAAIVRRHQRYALAVGSDANEHEVSFDRLAHDLLMKRIYELIPQLSPCQRKIFEMSFFGKMSLVEIAGKMGLKKSTVRVQYKRCIDFFRENIKTRAA